MSENLDKEHLQSAAEVKENKELKFAVESATEANEKHPNRNEDAVLIDPEHHTFGVFDGVGGAVAGDIASSSLSQELAARSHELELVERDKTKIIDRLKEILNEVNERLYKQLQKMRLSGSATTACLVYLWKNESGTMLTGVNVGDSRAYILRDDKLTQLTVDDNIMFDGVADQEFVSEMQEKMNNLAEPPKDQLVKAYFNFRSAIIQAVGHPSINPKIYFNQIYTGDKIILVTDGISDNLTSSEIQKVCATGNATSLVQAAQNRSREKHFRSKPDDMTAVIIEIK